MTAVMGPYEASLRTRHIEARARLEAAGTPAVQPPLPPPERLLRFNAPPLVAREAYRPIVRSIEYVIEEQSPLRWRKIVDEVLAKHNISMGQLCSKQRRQEIVRARFEAYFRLSEETTLSLPKIGKLLGGKDHTTVLYGIRTHRERLQTERAAA